MQILNPRGKTDEPQRNLWCSFYPFCLDIHVRYGKRRFTCSTCKRYKPIHLTPEEAIEEGIKCGEFLNALFFGVDLYERDEMKKTISDDELVTVPARILRGLVSSFAQGMYSFGGTSILIKKLDEILKQGNPGKADPGACSEPQTIVKET